MKHFKAYDFNLAANGSTPVYAVGRVLTLLEADGPVSVRVDGGSAVVLKVGQGLNLSDGDTWSEITVQDVSGAPNAGKLFVGAGAFTDQTFNGNVNATLVNDPDAVRPLLGMTYRSWFDKNFASNGSESHGLYNPVGSGRRVIVRSLEILDSNLANIQQRDISKWTSLVAPAFVPGAKTLGSGSVVSVAGVYTIAGTTPTGTGSYADGSNLFFVTGLRKYRGVILEPGQAFNVYHNAVAATKVGSIFEWDEEPL